jgi:hypothetical protein
MSTVDEPWSPKLGDRVRVRLSGEWRWDRDGAASGRAGRRAVPDRSDARAPWNSLAVPDGRDCGGA